jgi:hypothetical protein
MRAPALAVAVVLATSALAACKPAAAPTKEYAYPAWGFRASFPAQPKETDTPAQGANPHAFLAEYQDGSHDFAVLTVETSRTPADLDEMADAASGFLAQSSGSVAGIKAYAATSDGLDGREVELTKGGRTIATLRFFLEGGKFYQVAARSTLGGDDPAVKDFLFSFHTLGGAPAANNAAQPTNAIANAVAAPP